MRPPAPLALLLAPLLACFADGGSDTVATSKTASDATTSAGTDPSTTREPTTSTTLPPTSDSSTSAGPTTTDPTLTTDPTTTSPVDNCQLAPECTAGSVEDGGQCDSCGVLRRTCGPDCTWSPQTCELAPETCEYWLLPDKGQQWQRVAVDPNAAFAPKETVLTAVALLAPSALADTPTSESGTSVGTRAESGASFAESPELPVVAAKTEAKPPPPSPPGGTAPPASPPSRRVSIGKHGTKSSWSSAPRVGSARASCSTRSGMS